MLRLGGDGFLENFRNATPVVLTRLEVGWYLNAGKYPSMRETWMRFSSL
ncbi:hypothetical protein [Allorhodopirellula heiligendammensis]|uniref:Uncharacterized protein n=1 Tax=Allorhodopirellula heiligendammensis TaxID=2714739 RepID=A0A5C6C1M4_9BACT|nr:hypothetical protein [Allorhodopirellula heiligendammensis]TWU17867.1 hypothetical protein Poly21_00180 [Allorhodopirellula heiligendammensis]